MSRRHSLNPAADAAFPNPKEVVAVQAKRRDTRAAGASLLMFLVSAVFIAGAIEIHHVLSVPPEITGLVLLLSLVTLVGSVPLMIHFANRTMNHPGVMRELREDSPKKGTFKLK